MGRHPRVHSSEVLYHIISRGNNRQNIFQDDNDFQKFIGLLAVCKNKYHFYLYAYVLMSNHFHLLISINNIYTSKIMQSLLTSYTKYFNRKNKKNGHLFQGRYKAIICNKDDYMLELVRYIHSNPVRAGLALNPDDWKWSGHCELIAKLKSNLLDKNLILSQFGTGETGRTKYLEFVSSAANQKFIKKFHPGDYNPFLGNDNFELACSDKNVFNTKILKITLEQLLDEECSKNNIDHKLVRGKSRLREIALARRKIIRRAILEEGYKQSEVSKFFNCDASYLSHMANKSC